MVDRLHARVGSLVVNDWNFVPELVDAIACHHEPEAAPERARALVAAVTAGDLIARRIVEEAMQPSAEELGSALERARIDEETAVEIEHNSSRAFQVALKVF